jgi:hypothetical protein
MVTEDDREEALMVDKQVIEHYDQLFEWLCANEDTNIYDLVVEIKLMDGRTVRQSWRDRELRLREEERG